MDGRWIRKWSISGLLIAGAFGCNRNSVQTTDAQPISGVPMTTNTNKSLWGGSTAQPATEVVVEAPRKGPPKPETEVAIADVRLATALDENTPEASRASILDLARHGYQKALQLDPKNKAALLGLARYYSRLGDRDRSMEMYQKYLVVNPKDRDVVHEVAVVYARWSDWNSAVTWCDRALKLDPENLSYRRTMAFCLARGGRWEEAYAAFLQMHMTEAQARYNIARVLEHQNYPDASRQQLLMALQADPSCVEARELLAELDQSQQPGAQPQQSGVQSDAVNDPNAIQRTGYVPEQ